MQKTVFLVFMGLFMLNLTFLVHAEIAQTYVLSPDNIDGSSILPCNIDTCILSLKTEEYGKNDGTYVILSKDKGKLFTTWSKPFGNFATDKITLNLVMKGCDSLNSTCRDKEYPLQVQIWNGNTWKVFSEEKLTNIEQNYTYSLAGQIKLADGEYRVKLLNKDSNPSDYLMIDMAQLVLNYRNLDISDEDTANKVLNFFKQNTVFWQRVGIGIGSAIVVILLVLLLSKNKKIKNFFTFDILEHPDKDLDQRIEKYKKLQNQLESLERQVKVIDASRSETQKKYYTRAIDENTFKQLMQNYEQDRTKITNEISELKKTLQQYSG